MLAASLLMSACGKTNQQSGKIRGAAPPPRTHETPRAHLPPDPSNVSLDAYADGKRTVTFRTKHPEFLLQVVEFCHDGGLVETTQKVTENSKAVYTDESYIDISLHSSDCAVDRLTQKALDVIPAPLNGSREHSRHTHITPVGQLA